MTRTRVAVAGPNRHSTEAGSVVAELGGNAVDVTLAAMCAALVSEPGISSFGGGAFVTVAPPDSPPVTIDGSVAMPGRGRDRSAFGKGLEPLWLEYAGGIDLDVGAGSVGVPGTLVALEEAHRRYGRLPWREIVAPAARFARDGFRVGRAAGTYLALAGEPLFSRDPAVRAAIHRPDGGLVAAGDVMRLPELADFLDRVAVEGSAALFAGETAAALVAMLEQGGGLLTRQDLDSYEALVRPALTTRIDDWTWSTNPPPAVGGPVFTAMLLARPPTAHGRFGVGELIQVQRAVLGYRVRELDVAADRAAAAEAMLDSVRSGGSLALGGSPSTVHVSGVDADGVACAVTASAGYGAGLVAPGTGIWLNNCLGERELNRRGPHALEPGERLVSNMTPTVGRRDDGTTLAIGSPGADRIATAVFQTVLGLLDGLPIGEAIDRPRLHLNVGENGQVLAVQHESDLVIPAEARAVAGDVPWVEYPPRSMLFGGVAAALHLPDGELQAAADARREGSTLVG
jgi:gamma-glutamyltranspeptidase/glutathione hydrolase